MKKPAPKCHYCGRKLVSLSDFTTGVCATCANEEKLMKPTKPTPPVKFRHKPTKPTLCRKQSKSCSPPATKADLEKAKCEIMSAISEFAAKQKAFNDRLDTAVAGVASDVDALNKKIEELQNSPGSITPEDQALLDELETRGDAITAKLEALDALTPPTPPPA